MEEAVLDVRGLKCPMPIVKAKKKLQEIATGQRLKVIATDPGSVLDFQGWAKTNAAAFALVAQAQEKDEGGRDLYVHTLQRKG